MNSRKILIAAALLSSAGAGVSCTSIPPERHVLNEQSRLNEQRKGYPDPQNSAQQKEADQRAEQEWLRRKS